MLEYFDRNGGGLELPVAHHFAPGQYMREMFAPAGAIVIGHEHREEHLSILIEGSCVLLLDGKTKLVQAPQIIKAGAGTRKVAYVLADMRWVTVHPTDETDIEKIEADLVIKSQTWLEHKAKCLLRQ